MQLLDQAPLAHTAEGDDLLVALSPSGRWHLKALATPDHKASVSLWVVTESSPTLLRRWQLPGPQAARSFCAKLKRQLSHLPEQAKPSQALALLPIHAVKDEERHHRHRREAPVKRLSGT